MLGICFWGVSRRGQQQSQGGDDGFGDVDGVTYILPTSKVRPPARLRRRLRRDCEAYGRLVCDALFVALHFIEWGWTLWFDPLGERTT